MIRLVVGDSGFGLLPDWLFLNVGPSTVARSVSPQPLP